jgi:hypothetical protein
LIWIVVALADQTVVWSFSRDIKTLSLRKGEGRVRVEPADEVFIGQSFEEKARHYPPV